MHVLIIEDDLILSEQLAKLFTAAIEGVSIHQAYSLKDAERYLSAHSYPLISIDLVLPDGNGLEFAKKYREHFQTQQTDYFIISGTYDLETAFAAYDEAHCFKILPKPIVQADFDAAIARFQNRHLAVAPKNVFHHETKYLSIRIPYSEILYFEQTLKACTVYTVNNSYPLGRLAIKELLTTLPDTHFLQIHRSIVVNRAHIRLIDKQTGKWAVQLTGVAMPLPVGRTFQEVLG